MEQVEKNSMGVGAGFKGGRMPSTMYRKQRCCHGNMAYLTIVFGRCISYFFPG